MDRNAFDNLVCRVEARYEGRAAALARHCRRWVLLGYAAVLSLTAMPIVIGVIVFGLGVVTLPYHAPWLVPLGAALIVFGAAQAGMLINSELPTPEGIRLGPSEAPLLRAVLEDVRTALACDPIQGIVFNADYTASVQQQPRAGIFGWPRAWLTIGMPLMLALPADEFKAVLAHECAHVSRMHGVHGRRLCHLHRTWQRLFDQFQQHSSSTFVRTLQGAMRRFVGWFWPRFHARACVLSRLHEFEADRLAGHVTSPDAIASALWRIACTDQMLGERFWKTLWKEAANTPQAPANLCERMLGAMSEAPNLPQAARWCTRALQRSTDSEDTHPSLHERIEALGIDSEAKHRAGYPHLPHVSAAASLLDPDLAHLQERVDTWWRDEEARGHWAERHRRVAAIRRTLEPTDAAGDGLGAPAVLWSRIKQTIDVEGTDGAQPLIHELLALDPEHRGAQFLLGQQELDDDPARGEARLQDLFEHGHDRWAQAAGSALEQHFLETGQSRRLREMRLQSQQRERTRTQIETEQGRIHAGDTFVPHQLERDELDRLCETLAGQPDCASAWLVQKQLPEGSSDRMFVLCVDTQAGKARAAKNEALTTILLLEAQIRGRLFVVSPTGEFRDVARAIMTDEATIFDRRVR